MISEPVRCGWAISHPLLVEYHDAEWGVPLRDDRKLFEYLVLDSAQAGLSWLLILRKREGYARAFNGFDPEKIAAYGPADIERLVADPGIIRNRLKIQATIGNAQVFLHVQEEIGSFSDYLWEFVGNRTIVNAWRDISQIPAVSDEAEAMSKDLRRRGFRFVGPTICYAFMQAAGMVNDHTTDCFRYGPLTEPSGNCDEQAQDEDNMAGEAGEGPRGAARRDAG